MTTGWTPARPRRAGPPWRSVAPNAGTNRFLFALILALAPTALSAQDGAAARPSGETGAVLGPGRVLDLDSLFTDADEASAVVLTGDGRVIRHNPGRTGRRFLPASTFKIPNTLIALETGVATGPGHRIPWDSTRVPRTDFFPNAWARDQTLRSAFRNSVYWSYQAMAREVGPDRMEAWLERLDYGNRSIDGGVDVFWLHGGLRISPEEQVRFLKRMLEGGLPVGPASVAVVRDIAMLLADDAWVLYGKTGTSEVTATRENGWIVGWLEAGEDTAYYAINMEGEQVWEAWPPQRRHALAVQVLAAAGLIPRGAPPPEPG